MGREDRTEYHGEALFHHIAKTNLDHGTETDSEFERAKAFTTVIVFSALCLEAFVNRMLFRVLELPVSREKELSLEEKWICCPGGFGSEEGFDLGGRPFQDFAGLVRIRNDRLVHFKPHREANPPRVGESPDPSFGELVKDRHVARRCFTAVAGMIERLDELSEQAFDSAFIRGWPKSGAPKELGWGGETGVYNAP